MVLNYDQRNPPRVAEMSELLSYARNWLRKEPLSLGLPNWALLNRNWIDEVESGRPGFRQALRRAALEELAGGSEPDQQRAIAVLAVIGAPEDTEVLRGITQTDALLRNARTAIYEIEHR